MTKTTFATGDDPLLAPKEAAPVLGLSVSWMAKARLRGDGPRFVKVGRSLRYPLSYLRDYIRSRTRSSTSETISMALDHSKSARATILALFFFLRRNNRPSLYISIHQYDTV